MKPSLLQRIAPPRFADPETDRIARSAFSCALLFLVITATWVPAALLLRGEAEQVLLFGSVTAAALVSTAMLARAGRARLAAGTLVGTLFVAGTAGLWVEGGLRATATGTFIAVVLAAGLFFSRHVSWITAGLSLALLGATWALEAQGLLPAPRDYGPEREFLSTAIIISIVLVLVQLNFERIRESQSFLQAVTDAAPNAIYVYDLAELRTFYGNAASIEQLGHDPRESDSAQVFVQLVHPDDRDLLGSHMRNVLALGDGEFAEVEYRARGRDGDYRILRDQVRVFDRTPDGRVRQIVGSAEDVTEKREAEQALARSRERVERGERLAALGRLAGGIAHDFNNYLTVIIGATEVAATDPATTDSVRELIGDAHAAARRSAELTKQLLGFSQQRLSRPTHFELNTLLEECDRLLRRVIPEHIRIVLLPEASRSTAYADRSQVEQVVMNLAVNARDAMPDGGSLTLSTREHTITEAEASAREGVLPGEYVVLEVADTGIGMDDETRGMIFEPLFTTKEAGAGTGFGLATVEAVIAHAGGFVDVDTAVGTGTRFAVHLPLSDGAASDPALPDAPATRSGHERILLVEDDEYVRAFAQRTLRDGGYTVTSAGDGDAARRIFRETPDEFDLLLTDVMLPIVSGLDLAAELRRLRPGLRVLFMSGYAAGDLADHGLRPKDQLIDKPFTVEELHRKLRDALDRR